jgi:hypothetical protein
VALTLEVKRPRRESDHSPPSSAEVKECVKIYRHSPNTPSWRGAKLKKAVIGIQFMKHNTFFHKMVQMYKFRGEHCTCLEYGAAENTNKTNFELVK